MMFHCIFLLLCINSWTAGNPDTQLIMSKNLDRSVSYSYWPSFHNAAKMIRIRKRELQEEAGQNEGGGVKKETPTRKVVVDKNDVPAKPPLLQQPAASAQPLAAVADQPVTFENKNLIDKQNSDTAKVSGNATININDTAIVPPVHNDTKINITAVDGSTDKLDLSGPGVVKRGVIVFGGFALLAVSYFVFYRRKGNNKDSNSSHSAIDANQFRYGVLQSEDRRDNLELSRIPLTMESDDDEEEDLEIFDLEQKKKSLSYVNLQLNDEEVVNGQRDGSDTNDRENLLLDIEDANSDALINWSNSGNKSIL